MQIFSNIVKKDELREVQLGTLEILRESLLNSFGPMGSNTEIYKENMLTQYSKDGHTILSNIQFQDTIERSVKRDIQDITTHIVKKVGDGTTSAVILSSILFKELVKMESDKAPYVIIRELKAGMEKLKAHILENAQEFTPEMAYEISMISTNGNTEIATALRDIYREYGKDVFIDVSTSSDENSYLKSYDGMTLDTGYSDTAYINDSKKGVCSIRKPNIYAFRDPIDTPEMMSLFDAIIRANITEPILTQEGYVTPTVIIAPMISRDMSSYMTQLVEFMYKFNKDESNKPPFLLITNITQEDQFTDITRMCGCKMIKKYIDPKVQAMDVEKGLAPTLETIIDFCGTADIVESSVAKTKFVNPLNMKNENGELTDEYNTLVTFLESELKKAYEEKEDNNVTGTLKRRINSLKANMVEYLIGGISVSDRDSLRDLVEDAVLNCRSASLHGVGYGANFEGLMASKKLEESGINNVIKKSYMELVLELFRTVYDKTDANSKLRESLENSCPINLRTDTFDNDERVLCSIMTDVVMVEAVIEIVSIMFTCNQFLTETPVHNKYCR